MNRKIKKLTKGSLAGCAIFLFLVLLCPGQVKSEDTYPKLANYFLSWSLTETQAQELAKWDLVILDMEVQAKNPNLLQKMREWNPDIKMLVYITSQEIATNATGSGSVMRQKLAQGIADKWYLADATGKKLSWWSGTYLLNATNNCPSVAGERWNQYLVRFVNEELLASGYWDGVYYDNMWDNITYFAGSNIDLNRDGVSDSGLDQKWREGMEYLYSETRNQIGADYLILGNGKTRTYYNFINGAMVENFATGSWEDDMELYDANTKSTESPSISVINANTGNNGSSASYQAMRFGLGSALLSDGYYSFDYGDQDHAQTWWYDEYDVNLGAAIGEATSKNNYPEFESDIWSRDFANGISVVNSTDKTATVTLGGEYEKIHGTQDSTVNDGSIVSEVQIDSFDALILLKTFSSLNDVLFTNGSFVRFFRPDGSRVRNGFFVFDEAEAGGVQIARIDLDGNNERELVLVTNNKITVWRDNGQLYMRKYPYTADYKGKLKVAIGDLNEDERKEIYVAPSTGFVGPIKIFTRHGRQMNHDWYPFGTNYNKGYGLAVREVAGHRNNEVIISKGEGGDSSVYLFDRFYNPLTSWPAFEKGFSGGVNLTTGDVNGDGTDEIIVGAGVGKKPIIRTFDAQGKQLFSEFVAYETFLKEGIQVIATDVDYDGKDDIIGMSEGL